MEMQVLNTTNKQRRTLFPTSLFECDVEVNDELNREWRVYIEEHVGKIGAENLGLTPTNLQTVELFKPLVDTVIANAEGILEVLGYEKQKLEVSGLWGNVQQPNGRHRVHSHPNNYFSFCYYAQTGNGDCLTFHDFRPEHIIPKIKVFNDHNAASYLIDVYPKKLLMWPSWVKHEVIENPNYRVSMGGNIRIPKVLEAGSHGCMAQ